MTLQTRSQPPRTKTSHTHAGYGKPHPGRRRHLTGVYNTGFQHGIASAGTRVRAPSPTAPAVPKTRRPRLPTEGQCPKLHYPDIALHVPTLLLPKAEVALQSWAVIACDQHTSAPEYWEETERLVGDSPSTLRLVLPEARLGGGDREAAICAINRRMSEYLAAGVLVEQPPGFMLVERDVGRAAPRRGLVVGLDLEAFDYRAGSRTLIRSTEGTDPNRLPARIAVRRDAVLETPHILVLIDDPAGTVIEPLFEREWRPPTIST